SHPEGTRTGIEDAQRNAGIHHRDQKRRAQVEGAVAVHHDLNTRSVLAAVIRASCSCCPILSSEMMKVSSSTSSRALRMQSKTRGYKPSPLISNSILLPSRQGRFCFIDTSQHR